MTDTGSRAGTDVVESYVSYPASAGEPPEQLKAFARVALTPHETRSVRLSIPLASLAIDLHGTLATDPGLYEVRVGSSSAQLPISLPWRVR